MSVEPDPIPLSALLRGHAALAPDGPAITADGRTLSWRELEARTNRAARALIARGVKPDDLVTIVLPNGAAFLEACFACWKAGATPQPAPPRAPAAELASLIALAEPALVIAGADVAVEGRARTSYDDLLAESDDDSPLPDRIAGAWKALGSGGSTGRPKLIVSTSRAVAQSPLGWRLAADDVAVMPGPLYHNGPFATAIAAMTAGAHLVILPRFDAETVLQAVDAHHATWLYLVPTMMGRIWRLPDEVKARYAVGSLRTVWHLAAPCPPWLKAAWIEWLGPDVIWELYAATEGLAGTVINGAEWLEHRGSVGRVFTGAVKIVREDGSDAPPDVVGEVYMRQPDGAPETYRYVGAQARRMGGWQSLGDMGWMDADGYLYLADRRADMILVGGSNVYPAEIEAALEEHPAVRSCAVIGLPDEDLGSAVHAIVQPAPGLNIDDLRDFLSRRLSAYKRPRTYELVDTPVRDDAGKVRRSQLVAQRLQPQDG